MAFVNLDKWNALPKNYQSVLTQAGHYASNWMMARYDLLNPPALKKLLASGTKLHAFPPEVMQASFKSAMELYAEISATNDHFKKVYASLTDFANSGYQWYQVAELGFDSFMARNGLRS
jgi:TRAP-type mannitol/chloroaromatic compound transport system substrate-binding protein